MISDQPGAGPLRSEADPPGAGPLSSAADQPGAGPLSPAADPLTAAVRRVLPSVRADLERLVRIPSVSADPAAAPQLAASADAVASLLRQAGLPQVEILAVEGGQPAVLGHRPGPPGAPTVLLYAHHDVQPPGARADWVDGSTAAVRPTTRPVSRCTWRRCARTATSSRSG
jgi:hypothetical protein